MTPAGKLAAEALRECASMFRIGDQSGLISREELAREFNRRQHVAAEALAALEAEAAQPPSHEAMEVAVALEIQSALGFVTTQRIARLIDQAMFVRKMKAEAAQPPSDHSAGAHGGAGDEEMKITTVQKQALEMARDHGSAFAKIGIRRRAGGAYARMCDRLIVDGYLTKTYALTWKGQSVLDADYVRLP